MGEVIEAELLAEEWMCSEVVDRVQVFVLKLGLL
jgi:hypothetical protein